MGLVFAVFLSLCPDICLSVLMSGIVNTGHVATNVFSLFYSYFYLGNTTNAAIIPQVVASLDNSVLRVPAGHSLQPEPITPGPGVLFVRVE